MGALLLRCRARGIQTDSEAKETDIQSLGRAVVGGGVGGCGGHRETSGCRTKTIESGIYFFRDLGHNREGEVHDRRSHSDVTSSLPMGALRPPPSSHEEVPPNSQPPTLTNGIHDPRLQGAHFLCYRYR